jgi:hypothetical protein
MALWHQLAWGSLFLILCVFVETGMLLWCSKLIFNHARRRGPNVRHRDRMAILLISMLGVVAAHTVQVWIWAGVFLLADVLPDLNTAVYFALVTYTTLGYGDVLLGPGLRIFASFAAVAGMLGFGISTAFVVAVMGRMFTGNGEDHG